MYEPFSGRNHAVMYYGSEAALLNSLSVHYNRILNYAYIYHDRDNAPAHYHIALHLNNTIKSDEVISWFKEFNGGQNVMDIPMTNKKGFITYLTHVDEEDKEHYMISEIISNDLNFFLDKNLTAYNILCDLMNGAPLRYLAQNYGREFILNYKRYMDFASVLAGDDQQRDPLRYEKQLPPNGGV